MAKFCDEASMYYADASMYMFKMDLKAYFGSHYGRNGAKSVQYRPNLSIFR